MRERAPFQSADLAELDAKILSRASAVVAMQEVHAGNKRPDVIGLRHDCDAGHSLATAVKMAAWEAERGYRSTYYMLHTSPYWVAPEFRESLERIAILGHEIGIHADALADSFVTGRDPDEILLEAIHELRSFGFQVRGVAGHGNPLCNRDAAPGEDSFANDEQFVECARAQEGLPDRTITRGDRALTLDPKPLAFFGLDYEALIEALPHTFRCSDSGGRWLKPGFEETVVNFQNNVDRQLHLLVHPDWWAQAFPAAGS